MWLTPTRIVTAGLIGLYFLPACVADSPARSAVSVVDSSGVRIVHSFRPPDAEPLVRVAAEPIYRVGWEPDEPQFEQVTSGFLRPDGSVTVADGGANTLYLLNPTGDRVTIVGRSGEGPGEFSRISALFPLRADSFLVGDGGNNRVTIFSGAQYVTDYRFAAFVAPASYDAIARHPDGSYWLGPSAWVVSLLEQAPEGWIEAPLLRTRDFAVLDTAVSLPFVHVTGNSHPIRHTGQVLSSGSSLVHVTTDVAQVVWLDSAGSPSQIARWDASPRTLTGQDWAKYESGFRERNADRDPARVEEMLNDRRRDFGGTEPLFRMAVADRIGGVWLAPYDISEGGIESLFASSFELVSPDGVHLGSVTLPTRLRVLDATEDRLLAVELDEFDVQALSVYSLDRVASDVR